MTDQPNLSAVPDDLSELDDLPESPAEGNEVTHRPILRVWAELLSNAEADRETKISPQWATKVVQSYAGIDFDAVSTVHDYFYDNIEELRQILLSELETVEPGKLSAITDAKTDAEELYEHYLNVLLNWQLAFTQWEKDWDIELACPAEDLAAIGLTHNMFLGQTGLVNLLGTISLDIAEDDLAFIQESLMAAAEE